MKILITGGAGFIGSNLADFFASRGEDVTILDDLSRANVHFNKDWLVSKHGTGIRFLQEDIRNAAAVRNAVAGMDVVVHTAAQVAVTTSVTDPRRDFETNALGTINVLEAARLSSTPPVVMFTSTNKVYGGLEDDKIRELPTRYELVNNAEGIDEGHPLDFHSPYGCSKGAADQYVRDYFRIYGVRTVVFRMSCIYGTRQFGNEDQGWAAHFLRAAASGEPLTIYGDGKQVRDILWIGDLVRAFDLALQNIEHTQGQVYNIGGGAKNTLSIWEEFHPLIQEIAGRIPRLVRKPWRPGDQLYYVSDTRKAEKDFGWQATTGVRDGLRLLNQWIESSHRANA